MLATAASAAGYLLLILRWHGNTGLWEDLYIVPGGFGTGVAISATFIVLSVSLDKSELAIAGSGLYMTSSVGAILGLSTVAFVLQHALSKELSAVLNGFPNENEVHYCPDS